MVEGRLILADILPFLLAYLLFDSTLFVFFGIIDYIELNIMPGALGFRDNAVFTL